MHFTDLLWSLMERGKVYSGQVVCGEKAITEPSLVKSSLSECGFSMPCSKPPGKCGIFMEINFKPRLFPGGINRLAHHERGVCAGAGPEFFGPAVVDFGEVEISLLVDAHSVDVPERAGPIASAAPLV